jgi:hypothetical protein
LELYGNGWFDATDVRIYTGDHKDTQNIQTDKRSEITSSLDPPLNTAEKKTEKAPIPVDQGQDIIFSRVQMRSGEIKEQGGPLNRLELSPGTYEISARGGKQTIVTLNYVLSGDPRTQLVVRALVDENCLLNTASLVVPAGQQAQGFRFQIYSTWMPCKGTKFPNSIGFVIKRQ